MSFDFTSAASFKPKVENTFLGKGGGGGNTGYFQQGRKKKEENNSILSQLLDEDILEKVANAEVPELDNEPSLLHKIKGFFSKQ